VFLGWNWWNHFLSGVSSSGIMSFSSRWSVVSKDFELVVVGGETGERFHENCKGKLSSILMDRDEIAWLVRIFEELVVVEDLGFLESSSTWVSLDHCSALL
jgi:hypothetical protein